MGAEHRNGLRRDLGKVLNEDGPFVFQAFDHVFVVHDLVPDIDRGAVLLERPLDDLDRTHHARAKPARLCQINFHRTAVTQVELPPIWHSIPVQMFAISTPTFADDGAGLCVKKRPDRKDGSSRIVRSRYMSSSALI